MVQESSSDWQTIDTLWISNGGEHERARVEIRLQLADRMAGQHDLQRENR